MKKERPFYGDAQAFFGFPGEAPSFDQNLMLDLALVTCAPPVGPHAQSLKMTLDACKQFKDQLAAIGAQRVRLVTRAAQIDVEDERTHVVLGLQNLPDDVSSRDLGRLGDLGVQVIAMAYDSQNAFGSGCLNLDLGFTEGGKNVLRTIGEKGFILDLSHAGHRMAREVLEFIDKENIDIPVMASHGGCYAVYPHFRNLPDDVLAAIAKRGGVVGIANLTFILDREHNSSDAFWRHLKHAMEICGSKAVVIGSDAPHVTYGPWQGQAVFEQMKGLVDPHGTWASRYPMYTPEFAGPDKMKKIENFLMPGVDILGLNLLDFFKRSLPK